jgi:hypothetical protein
MKIRTDFVTNSSSSSFIIVRQFKGKPQGKMIEKLFDVYLRTSGDSDFFYEDTEHICYKIETEKDLNRNFYDYDNEHVKPILKLLKDGADLQYVSWSHHTDKTRMLRELEKEGYLRVVHSWED